VWRRYSAHSFHTTAQRKATPAGEAAITKLVQSLEQLIGNKLAKNLQRLDPKVCASMRHHHRAISNYMAGKAYEYGQEELIAVGGINKNTGKRPNLTLVDETKWSGEEGKGRQNTSSIQKWGHIMALSSGNGTGYHYDKHDDGKSAYSLQYTR
jgi:hypothetical protein